MITLSLLFSLFFFFNDTATTEIYTLSLHDALPISPRLTGSRVRSPESLVAEGAWARSEEHTSELQSHSDLVCRLLLEKKPPQRNRDQQPVHTQHHQTPGQLCTRQ